VHPESIYARCVQVTDEAKPLAGVSIYVSHSDAKGLYTIDGSNSDENARLHGAMRSDANGRYRYETIRPKGYGNAPAHVHCVATAPGYKPRTFELWFEDQHAGSKDGAGVRQA